MLKKLLLSLPLLAAFTGFSQCGSYFVSTPLTLEDTNGNCNGETYGEFVGGTGPYECYIVFQSDTISTFTLSSPDVVVPGLCVGLYVLDVTDANGCQDTATFYVSGPDPCASSGLAATTTATAPSGPGMCNGSITVTPTGGTAPYSYAWDGAPFSNSATISNFCPGSHEVIVMDAAGCTTAPLTDTVPQAPCANSTLTIVSMTGTDPSSPAACDGAITVAVTGGVFPYVYSWSPAGPIGGSTVSNLCAGTYTVTIVDSEGCAVSATDSVGSPDPCAGFTIAGSVQNVSANGLCDGAIAVTPSGGAATVTYVWSNGTTTQTVTALCPGTYTVTATDANGCTATNAYNVTEPGINNGPMSGSVSTTNASTDGACDGTAVVSVTGGTSPFQYWQSNGANSAVAANLCEGYYSVTVVDANSDTLYLDYIIVDPTNLIVNTPYPDSTVIDSLAGSVVELCNISLGDVTASYAVSYFYPSPDSVSVIWAIETDSSGTINLTMSYAVDSVPSGVYSVALSVYCPQKSGPQYLQIYDQLYIGELSLAELSETALIAYPNPFTETLAFNVPQSAVYTVALTDVTGRIVRSETAQIDGNYQLSGLSQLASGRYVLQVSSAGYHAIVKVMK